MRRLLIVVVIVLAGCGGDPTTITRGDVADGAAAYETLCAGCHGRTGEGVVDKGPPLAHPMYLEPGYSDADFAGAVRNGASSPAWEYPLMPAMPGISEDVIGDVLAYVRSLQES